jgi:hypothetical protein
MQFSIWVIQPTNDSAFVMWNVTKERTSINVKRWNKDVSFNSIPWWVVNDHKNSTIFFPSSSQFHLQQRFNFIFYFAGWWLQHHTNWIKSLQQKKKLGQDTDWLTSGENFFLHLIPLDYQKLIFIFISHCFHLLLTKKK